YRANDGQSNSTPATATISVLPPALSSDNFTRGTDPGPLDPWLVHSANWTVPGGMTKGGTTALTTYALAYITNSYNTYSVQERVPVYFDNNLMTTAPDQEATPYLSGSAILDMWTDNTGYQMSVDDVIINPLAVDDNYTAAAGSTLNVGAAGVLLNDTEMFGSN